MTIFLASQAALQDAYDFLSQTCAQRFEAAWVTDDVGAVKRGAKHGCVRDFAAQATTHTAGKHGGDGVAP